MVATPNPTRSDESYLRLRQLLPLHGVSTDAIAFGPRFAEQSPMRAVPRYTRCRQIAAAQLPKEIHHGQIRQEGSKQGRKDDARAQTRNLAQRTVGQEGDQPQAGDRDRPVGSAPRRRQGAEAEIVFIVEGIVAVARHRPASSLEPLAGNTTSRPLARREALLRSVDVRLHPTVRA